MSPLQAAAVEKRLCAVRREVVRMLYANSKDKRPARYEKTVIRREFAARQLNRVLAIIDKELQSVKEPAQ